MRRERDCGSTMIWRMRSEGEEKKRLILNVVRKTKEQVEGTARKERERASASARARARARERR
eukprot:1870849-Pleurochrysis_carterae.AAC.1